MRTILAWIALAVTLAGCAPVPDNSASTGQVGTISRLTEADEPRLQFRQLDTVNALRQAQGLRLLVLSAPLNAAAKTHALDMSRQNRPWHFGSDGSSPIDRVVRAGYTGTLVGENISESFEDDLTTLRAWMNNPQNAAIVLDPRATTLGFAYYQEPNGKMWWVQLVGM